MNPTWIVLVIALPALVIGGFPPMKQDRPAVLLFIDKLGTAATKQLNDFCNTIFMGPSPDCSAAVPGGLVLQSFCQYTCRLQEDFKKLQQNPRWIAFEQSVAGIEQLTLLSEQEKAVAAQQWLWKNNYFDKINKEYTIGSVTFNLGDNKFSTWALEQMSKLSALLLPPSSTNLPPMECNVADFKASIDYRPLMRVRDQGSCGSCWALASASAIGGVFSATHPTEATDYSTQQLLDCSGAMCKGATFQATIDFYKTVGGLAPESSKPYVGEETSPSCTVGESEDPNLYLHDYTLFYKEAKTVFDIQDLENRLICSLQTGPVAVGISATDEMMFYKSGIFDSVFDQIGSINHAVVVVGYTSDYFIVMNSYGASWGENGYIRLPRGKNAFHMTEYQFAPKNVQYYPKGSA